MRDTIWSKSCLLIWYIHNMHFITNVLYNHTYVISKWMVYTFKVHLNSCVFISQMNRNVDRSQYELHLHTMASKNWLAQKYSVLGKITSKWPERTVCVLLNLSKFKIFISEMKYFWSNLIISELLKNWHHAWFFIYGSNLRWNAIIKKMYMK